MKTIVFALVAAILVAGQFFTPVAAAPSSSVLASSTCGDTYTVEPMDWLAKIARYCGTTVGEILALNPQIVNPNIIYTGQVIRMTSNSPVPSAPVYNNIYYPGYTTYYGSARVTVSTTRAAVGASVTVYASGFPANSEIDYRVGQMGANFSVIYDGTVGSDGTSNQTIIIPSDAVNGEYWVVEVITTSLANVTAVNSHSIYIADTTYTSYTSYARVSLSTTQAVVGGSVTVYVSGFPANSEIDYRVGKQGADFSVVYDGTINSSGTSNQTITIPSGAVAGEYWVVKVITTSLANITEVTSHTIYITN